MQKSQGFKVLSVVDPKPSAWEPDVKVVDILKFNMHLMCKILGCWFWVECFISTIYLCSIEFWIEGAEMALIWQGNLTQVNACTYISADSETSKA
jgi:hypothetical protein